ncbi:hypothetical protein B0H14DRAFT_2345354, partial [Mycena olivaceomarginata]
VSTGYPTISGMFFSPNSAEGAGEIAFGGVDTNKFTAPLLYSPLVDSSNRILNSEGIFVNGQTASGLQNNVTLIFHSGTSNILFVEPIAQVRLTQLSCETH